MEQQGKKAKELQQEIRLNKYMAQCGICSRREADRLIAEGKVTVNGIKADAGKKVGSHDRVALEGNELEGRQRKVVLAYYKPVGVVCTERDSHAQTILSDVISYPVRVTYAGRLDKDSEGLLLLTNDGELIEKMMKGSHFHEKEYLVRTDKEITDVFLKKMSEGIYLEELKVRTRPCRVEKIGKCSFRIVLTQGLNRQIRRMCETLEYKVCKLKRIRVMNISLTGLAAGEYRELTAEESRKLYQMANDMPEPLRKKVKDESYQNGKRKSKHQRTGTDERTGRDSE